MKNDMLKLIFGVIMLIAGGQIFAQNTVSQQAYEKLCEINAQWLLHDQPNITEDILSVLETDTDWIQWHLLQVEESLRQNPPQQLSASQMTHRLQCLDYLHNYALAKTFPINTYHKHGRQPYFKDIYGTNCAVGQLIVDSGFGDFAQYVAATNNYAYIEEMDYPQLYAWADDYGFTLNELKWIQPSYYPSVLVESTVQNASCQQSNGSISVSVSPAWTQLPPSGSFTLQWYVGIPSQGDMIGNGEVLENVAAGFYTLLVLSDGIAIQENYYLLSDDDFATTPYINLTNQTCPNVADGAISVGFTDNSVYTYKWYDAQGNFLGNNSAVQNLQGSYPYSIMNAPLEYNYRVEITNVAGCKYNQYFLVIIENEAPYVATFQQNVTPACNEANGAISLGTIYAAEPYTVSWSNGATSANINNLFAGTYDYTVTDANGCSTEGAVIVPEDCGTTIIECDPTNLAWLEEIIQTLEMSASPNCMCISQILQVEYNGEVAYYVDSDCNAFDAPDIMYNCEGEEICSAFGLTPPPYCGEFDTLQVIWTCSGGSQTCYVSNPLNELAWFGAITEGSSVMEYNYGGQTVFYIAPCEVFPDAMSMVMDCEGNFICGYGGIAGLNGEGCPDFFETAMPINIWKTCDEIPCDIYPMYQIVSATGYGTDDIPQSMATFEICFNDSSELDGEISSYLWTCSNGQTANTEEACFTFASIENGVSITTPYTLCLEITTTDNCSASYCHEFYLGGGENCVNPNNIVLNAPCPEYYQPVCGCNGKTYDNPCFAEVDGVNAWTDGFCETTTDCGNVEDLQWLQDLINNLQNQDPADPYWCYCSVQQWAYQGNTYFVTPIEGLCLDTPSVVYNCDGSVACVSGGLIIENQCSEVLPGFWENAVFVGEVAPCSIINNQLNLQMDDVWVDGFTATVNIDVLENDILPWSWWTDDTNIFGKWKLTAITGGFTGGGTPVTQLIMLDFISATEVNIYFEGEWVTTTYNIYTENNMQILHIDPTGVSGIDLGAFDYSFYIQNNVLYFNAYNVADAYNYEFTRLPALDNLYIENYPQTGSVTILPDYSIVYTSDVLPIVGDMFTYCVTASNPLTDPIPLTDCTTVFISGPDVPPLDCTPYFTETLNNLIAQANNGDCCGINEIKTYSLNGEPVIMTIPLPEGSPNCPADLGVVLYDCQGNIICTTGFVPIEFYCQAEILNNLTNENLVWTCGDTPQTCNPQDLAWLQEELANLQNGSDNCVCTVAQYVYNGQTVFFFDGTEECNAVDFPDWVVDCDGNVLCYTNGEVMGPWCYNFADATFVGNIWTCEDNGPTYYYTICEGESITIGLLGQEGNTIYTWSPSDNLTCAGCYSTVATPTESTVYTLHKFTTIGETNEYFYFNITVEPCTPCVNPNLIDPSVVCPAVYDPVCGCNGVTYSNDCEAMNYGGVTSWTPGACGTTNFCYQTNPLNELTWLSNISEGNSIVEYLYNGESVFFVEPCEIIEDGMSVLYSCNGEYICGFGGIIGANGEECPDFPENATLVNIWKTCGGESPCGENQSCVWPGDADNNTLVNNFDVLALGLGYNFSGYPRANASLVWESQAAQAWSNSFAVNSFDEAGIPIDFNTVAAEHADCNGDGIINIADVAAIDINYGLQHGKTEASSQQNTVNSNYSLAFEIANGDSFAPGDTVLVDVNLVNNDVTASFELYGLAFSIDYGQFNTENFIALDNTVSLTYDSNSWFGNGSTPMLNFSKKFETTHLLHAAYSRTNHQAIAGSGKIATLRFVIDDNLAGKTASSLNFTINAFDAYTITTSGNLQPMSVESVSSEIILGTSFWEMNGLEIYPVPAQNTLQLQWQSNETITNLTIIDVLGKKRLEKQGTFVHNTQLDVSALASGVYFLNINTDAGEAAYMHKIQIVK
ncbi:MAG: T9SS type A sorting domain-containing protein [Chitinophagales bacterium]|nr:T9SS type A sorting domain-containing protein [Bacteroidota bacterium]MCB9042404.1 T9SS type A sorting domain-containing protein [Chitinophagales bacterium]